MAAENLEKLKTLLIAKHMRIAVAESLTCGHLQATLGAISGASNFFEGGITAYNIQQKIRLLNVDIQEAGNDNAVSLRVAQEMAAGVCRLFQCDIGIGTTGYAEASPDNGILVPLAYYAICRRIDGKITDIAGQRILGQGLNRIAMQEFVSSCAVAALLAYVEQCQPSDDSHQSI